MDECLRKDVKLVETILNTDILHDHYDPKFTVYQKYLHEFETAIGQYCEFDKSNIDNFYQDLPFHEYFSNRNFWKISELKCWTLFTLQQYLFSISVYNIFLEENAEKLRQGVCKDPLVEMLNKILEVEGKAELVNSRNLTSENDAKVLASVPFQIIISYFVHLLSN